MEKKNFLAGLVYFFLSVTEKNQIKNIIVLATEKKFSRHAHKRKGNKRQNKFFIHNKSKNIKQNGSFPTS
jgi:hypothetical protein